MTTKIHKKKENNPFQSGERSRESRASRENHESHERIKLLLSY